MNTHFKNEVIVIWLTVFAVLFSSCGGQVNLLQPIASIKGMQAATAGAWDTYRYVNDFGEVLLVWWQRNMGWGMSLMSQTARDPLGAWNYLSGGKAFLVEEFGDIDKMLIDRGWRMVEPNKLSPEFVKAVTVGYEATMAYLATLALNWCSFIVVPAGELPEYPGRVQN